MKKFTLEAVQTENGDVHFSYDCIGFKSYEVIGLMEVHKNSILHDNLSDLFEEEKKECE